MRLTLIAREPRSIVNMLPTNTDVCTRFWGIRARGQQTRWEAPAKHPRRGVASLGRHPVGPRPIYWPVYRITAGSSANSATIESGSRARQRNTSTRNRDGVLYGPPWDTASGFPQR